MGVITRTIEQEKDLTVFTVVDDIDDQPNRGQVVLSWVIANQNIS